MTAHEGPRRHASSFTPPRSKNAAYHHGTASLLMSTLARESNIFMFIIINPSGSTQFLPIYDMPDEFSLVISELVFSSLINDRQVFHP